MNWTFCNEEDANCKKSGKNEVGAFVDLALLCKGRKKPTEMRRKDRQKSKKKTFCFKKPETECPKSYDMGGNSEMLLSPTVSEHVYNKNIWFLA